MMGGMGGGHMGGGMWHLRENMSIDKDDLGRAYNHKVAIRLLAYVRPFWRRLSLIMVAVLVYTLTIVSMPWLIGRALAYVDKGDLEGMNLIVLAFMAIALLQFGSQYIHMRVMAFVGQRMLLRLRIDLFKHLQRLSMSFYDRNETGRVMSRVQNDVQQLQELVSLVVSTLADVVSLTGIIIVMVLINPRLALITLTVVPLLILVLAVWQRYARSAFLRARLAISGVNAGLQENISGVRVVQSLNRQEANIERFDTANSENMSANLQATRLQAVLFPSVEMLTAMGLALVVYFGGTMVIDGSLEDASVLLAFALFIQRFFDPVRNLTMQYGQLQRAMASGSRIFELLDMEPEVADRSDAVELPKVKGEVRYEGVGFRYVEDVPVLEDVELHVAPGETVAIVGPTGAGKTTLVALLQRLYDVTEGRITIDGNDIRDVSMKSLASQIKVVHQDPYLFSQTIAENIRYNNLDATDEQVEAAAKAVGAHDFISKLELGYDTPLNERGTNLSIGQRQLISFARALAAGPQILILDEATANIDTETEQLIQRALEELLKDRTALVIAHRLSTVRNADRIVVMDKGRIVEQGKHDELMALNGLYAKLSSFSNNEAERQPVAADGAHDGRRGMWGHGGGGPGGRWANMSPEEHQEMMERRRGNGGGPDGRGADLTPEQRKAMMERRRNRDHSS